MHAHVTQPTVQRLRRWRNIAMSNEVLDYFDHWQSEMFQNVGGYAAEVVLQ